MISMINKEAGGNLLNKPEDTTREPECSTKKSLPKTGNSSTTH
jgi:hypothetical protein